MKSKDLIVQNSYVIRTWDGRTLVVKYLEWLSDTDDGRKFFQTQLLERIDLEKVMEFIAVNKIPFEELGD